MLSVSLAFDYSLDTKGFFSSTERRSALEFAGKLVADNLGDTLSAITPSGSNRWTPAVLGPATGSLTLSDSIGSTRDVDMFRVYAQAGTRLTATATPNSALDTLVRIYDLTGNLVATGDQTGNGTRDGVTVSVSRSDYYVIAVSSSQNRGYNPLQASSGPGGPTGSYSLALSMQTPA